MQNRAFFRYVNMALVFKENTHVKLKILPMGCIGKNGRRLCRYLCLKGWGINLVNLISMMLMNTSIIFANGIHHAVLWRRFLTVFNPMVT
jgi:hypothetical protein